MEDFISKWLGEEIDEGIIKTIKPEDIDTTYTPGIYKVPKASDGVPYGEYDYAILIVVTGSYKAWTYFYTHATQYLFDYIAGTTFGNFFEIKSRYTKASSTWGKYGEWNGWHNLGNDLANKAEKTMLTNHILDNIIHITAEEREKIGVDEAVRNNTVNISNADGGGAVGYDTEAFGGGGAVGYNTKAHGGGGAVGSGVYAYFGGAIGFLARTDNGGAIGRDTFSQSGFAGGYNAKANGVNNIQLGEGINNNEKTLQVYNYQLLDAQGKIPIARIPGGIADEDVRNNEVNIANESGGFTAGKSAYSEDGGGAVGQYAEAFGGGAVGYEAKAYDNGGAVGKYAIVENGGGAVGHRAEAYGGGGAMGYGTFTNGGGAVGYYAGAYDNGGAVGSYAEAYGGSGAVGNTAIAYNGSGAMGQSAEAYGGGGAVGKGAYSEYGGAVGSNTYSQYGFAGGYNARANGQGSIQLGTGTNNIDKTLQIYDFQLLDANGHIPLDRTPMIGTLSQALQARLDGVI